MDDAESSQADALPVSEQAVERDLLTIYGMSFEFPKSRKLEFNPKFRRDEGDVAVKAVDKTVVFVSWGQLDKIAKRAPTIDDHAKFSLDRVKKSVQGKMKLVDQKTVDINGHEAAYNHVKIQVPSRGFLGKAQEEEVTSVHIHCSQTGRYYVIYGQANASNAADQEKTLQCILETFRCH